MNQTQEVQNAAWAERRSLEREIVKAAREWYRLRTMKAHDRNEIAELDADVCLGEAMSALEAFEAEQEKQV